MKMYVLTFSVTDNSQNGNEITFKKDVYSKVDQEGTLDKIQKAENLLKKNHFYNIQFLSAKIKEVLFV